MAQTIAATTKSMFFINGVHVKKLTRCQPFSERKWLVATLRP
jgi:hypothetical protein